MNKEIIEKLMDKYAEGKLSELEQKQLDAISKDKPDIVKSFKVRKDIVKSIQYLGNRDLEKMLDKIHKEEIEQPRKKSHTLKLIAIGAAVLITFLIFYQVLKTKGETVSNDSNFYASYYQPYIPSVNSRGDAGVNSLENLFAEAYANRNYEEALELIQPSMGVQENEIVLMAAVSAFESNENELAHTLLDKIINEKDYYFEDHARWYKAMIYLKESKNKEAKNMLEILVSDRSSDHYKEAKELLLRF